MIWDSTVAILSGAVLGETSTQATKWPLNLYQMSSILFGDIMVPNIEQDYILRWGIVFSIRKIILLGSTTKKLLI